MRTIDPEDLPLPVKCEDTRIPLADGTTLATRIWRPESADAVPAVLEFIPYRLRDMTAVRDSMHHPYLAGHGIAGVRVDLRGSGDSDGVLADEYLAKELDDAEEVLAWLAEQPWCSGRTGMMGISWGGFNALQVAARRPESLGAIATVCSTDDRYSDDVHYMGGCLLGDNLSWASVMQSNNALPPDPDGVGDKWEDMWLQRLQGSGLWAEKWLRHQRRDDYWRHGSVCEDYDAIQIPVLAASGWADGYSNAVFRLLEHLDVPRRGLIGPWSHTYPHLGQPGPAIGFLQELVRWFGRWLADEENGVDEGCSLCTWMQDTVPPSTAYEDRPGRWVADPSWPSPHVTPEERPLLPGRIGEPGDTGPEVEQTVSSPLSVGQFGGKWCSYNAPPDLPYDQREEDGGSLVFETEQLRAPVEILGAPVLDLEVTADAPVAMVAARLSDVAPGGPATRVTYGLLNLTHRDSHAEPAPLEPGKRYRVRVELNGVAQYFPPGHRIRISLSTSYWPLAWPPPEPVQLAVTTGRSSLTLPVRDPEAPDAGAFEPAEGVTPLPVEQVRPGEQRWEVRRDLVDYVSELLVVKDLGRKRFPDGLEVDQRVEERYSARGDDHDSVRGEVESTVTFRRGDHETRSVTRTVQTSDAKNFYLHATVDGYRGETRIASVDRTTSLPRDLV
ncbi:CocE/NonD family hydrolase [Pseudonocardia parietis]|uniref:CocE/NonD family hydrolase n=1 Tax=Pseudonocardia parietis TaxID=570936 RepID=A0ABS4VRI3_9PSEU|nr:CocE/NonD family hydrolase [Pseudonocardia parietis]MBP2366532.1 putative CocE/NonD family hydrolase [Pseudonocardia parietis]